MRRGVVVGIGCAILLLAAVVGARAERLAQDLTVEELQSEMEQNRALRAYVQRNGMPDIAERRFLSDRPPWSKDEVTLYYLDERLEIGFASASILDRPEVQIIRNERPLTDEEAAELANRPRLRASGVGGPVARAEAAARRAEEAAARVEAAVAPIERLADRTEALVARARDVMYRSFTK